MSKTFYILKFDSDRIKQEAADVEAARIATALGIRVVAISQDLSLRELGSSSFAIASDPNTCKCGRAIILAGSLACNECMRALVETMQPPPGAVVGVPDGG